MTANRKEIENEAMKLSLNERAALAEKFLLSLNAPSEIENLQLWVNEAECRLKELRDEAAKAVPAEEVFRRAIAAIS
ncbi:MAG: addiction module protein [Candidatus Omnitrophota bacterium]